MMYRTVRITEVYAGPVEPKRAGKNVVWHDTSTAPAIVKLKIRNKWSSLVFAPTVVE